MGSGVFGKGEESSTSTSQVNIPEFLRPLIEQSVGAGQGGLRNLQDLIGGDLVADFTQPQTDAQNLAIARAGGAGGFIPTAQNTILNAARGQGLNTFLPPAALNALTQGAEGRSFLPEESRAALTQLGLGGGALPGTETLQQTARGDFLFGGEGFDQAVEAAVRAARPALLSTFGSAGAGGATGGLAQSAIGQSAVDAFASQFGQQRQQQLAAANQLANLGLAGRGQRIGALGLLGDIGQGEIAQQTGAAGTLAGFGEGERIRQLQAAGILPDIATADINLLNQVGGIQQGQQQREIDAPFNANRALLESIFGIPGAFSPLFGQTATGDADFRKFGLSFGDSGGSGGSGGSGSLLSLFGG